MNRIAAVLPFSLLLLVLGASACAQDHGGQVPLDPIMGEFEGTVTLENGKVVKAEAKVLADEDNKYRIVLLYPVAEPKVSKAEGDVGKQVILPPPAVEHAETIRVVRFPRGAKDGGAFVRGDSDWKGTVTANVLKLASEKTEEKAEMKRVERKSPTLGQKPPAGAIVLLPFEEGKPTNLDQWAKNPWVCEPDGSVSTREADIKTNKDFGNFKLHVEFRVPFMPAARDQARGNSGVFLHGRYEIQVLDSFGLKPTPVDCAGIFNFKAPDADASLPPGQWQTYDIDFAAPKFDADGKQTKGAVVTVLWNGMKVHDAVEVKTVSGGAWGAPAKTGPVRLQYHGNAVRFRNIWLVEEK